MSTITKDEFLLIRNYIEKECGIALSEEKSYLIESRFATLLLENGCDNFSQLYLKLKEGNEPILKRKIIDAITTNETLWFRDESPYVVLRDQIFPEYLQECQQNRRSRFRIWSAACSSGQEPYSIAMMAEHFSRQKQVGNYLKDRMSILATDISSSVLMLAKLARYDTISMSRGMLPGFTEQYFSEEGKVHVLKDEIKQMVSFQQFNLQDSFMSLGKFDVILLRNVAIYFSIPFKVELIRKMANALNPGGYLFLGASETLTGLSQDFEIQKFDRGTYYRLKS
jgi:chemotaxis protein methyltransferase CheR